MRIIAGKFRRRKLQTNPGLITRPLPDRAKEMLFARLESHVAGKRIADVFAGTGTMGLEALSRGAASVVFIEYDRRAHQLLLQNVETLGVGEQVLCCGTDALWTSFKPKGVAHLLPYDTVFFDPPFRMIADLKPAKPMFKSLERLAREGVTSEHALLILRTPRDACFDCPDCWTLRDRYDLSIMSIYIYAKNRPHQNGDGPRKPIA